MTLPVIFLMGPTAAGKTALAVELAQHLPVELVNVDSALIYQGLDIGAARPDNATLEKAPHRLLGIRTIQQPYSAADFRADALAAIREIHANNRLPVLVGGTMLYFKALAEGLADLPAADPVLRERLDKEAADLGWPVLHQRLARVDPETAARLSPNDSQRLQRALEVYELTGVTLSAHHRRQKRSVSLFDKRYGKTADFPYTIHAVAVSPHDRSTLHARIEARMTQMFADGLVEEVRQLCSQCEPGQDLPALRAVGYRQVREYLEERLDWDAMMHKTLVATRQLAKRQLTWLRSWPDVTWLYSDDRDVLLADGFAYARAVVRNMQSV